MAKPKPLKEGLTSILESLGLSENEAVLYLAMLERQGSTVRELSVRAPFPRTMLYYVLNQLMRRGLVTARDEKSKKTVYTAEDPERLYDALSKKEKEFEKVTRDVRELVPKLKNRYRLAGKRPTVRMFEGLEEYQKALEDIFLSRPEEILSYEFLIQKKPGRDVRNAHDRGRLTKKILRRVLFSETEEALEILRSRRYDDHTQFRSIKKKIEVDMTLYSGKILYTYYDTHEPSALLVEDMALYEMQKSLFETFWEVGKDRTLSAITKP